MNIDLLLNLRFILYSLDQILNHWKSNCLQQVIPNI